MPKSIKRCASLAVVAALLSGCNALPSFGPSDTAVLEGARSATPEPGPLLSYDVVNISSDNVGRYGVRAPRSFTGDLATTRLRGGEQRLATGDVLQVTVREPSDDGLFATAGKRAEEISVIVDGAGNINLPYISAVPARGRTVADVRAQLSTLYARQAIDPEIQLRRTSTDASNVSVLGDVGSAGRIAIPLRGLRLLDLIAQAGGISAPAWEVHVTLVRGATSQTVRYDDILALAKNNVALRADDIVQVSHRPRKFDIFGAVKNAGRFGLDEPVATVVSLLGAAGGLDGGQAEPRSIFVYRSAGRMGQTPATVYRFDLRRPDAFFLGTEFAVQEGDVIYVATADTFDLTKFLSFVVRPLNQISSL